MKHYTLSENFKGDYAHYKYGNIYPINYNPDQETITPLIKLLERRPDDWIEVIPDFKFGK